MKKTFLFCTKPLFFLTEIPPVFLLIIAILQNSQADGILKLYPLIAVLSIAIKVHFNSLNPLEQVIQDAKIHTTKR